MTVIGIARSKEVALKFNSLQGGLHDNGRDEQEGWEDEACKGADQDSSKRLEEAARDVIVFSPASAVAQLDVEEFGAVKSVGEHERSTRLARIASDSPWSRPVSGQLHAERRNAEIGCSGR